MFFEYPALLWLHVNAFRVNLVHRFIMSILNSAEDGRTCVFRMSNSGRPADVLYWV